MPAEPGVLAALNDYLTKNPETTFRPQVQALIVIAKKAFDEHDASAATRIATRITESGMADICAVPLKKVALSIANVLMKSILQLQILGQTESCAAFRIC